VEEAPTVRRDFGPSHSESIDAPTWRSTSGPRVGELPSLIPGHTLAGRYTVLEPLGEGGMGFVLAAYDSRLDRRVALKLLRRREGASSGDDDNTRLAREAQAMARLNHPNVVAVYDTGALEDGSLFIAMEYVRGQTLRQWHRQQPRSWRQVLELYLSAGRGLVAAHSAGLIHRDFKPDNVLVGEDGRVRVTDFGLARAHGAPNLLPEAPPGSGPPPSATSSSGSWGQALTLPGSFMGTPGYMAPELIRGHTADVRTDIFAFCAALYEALYGQLPFRGSNPSELTRAQIEGKVAPPPASSEVPEWVSRTVARGLSTDPLQRPASMEEVLAALGEDPEVRRRARLRVAALASGVAVLAGLALWGWARQHAQPNPCEQQAQQLAGIWDAPVKAQVQKSLLGTGLPFAPDTFTRVSAVLDGYAGQWVKQRTELCEAARQLPTSQGGLELLKESCLDRRRSRLRALTELLARGPDPELIVKAVQAAQSLPPLEYCADVQALTSAVLPPEDPALRAKVAELQAQVDRLEALHEAGKYPEGLALSAQLLPGVEAAGFAPLHARTLYQTARLREGNGDGKGSEELLRQSIALAARGKDLTLLALAWGRLVFVVGYLQSRPQEAVLLVPVVEAAAELAGDDLSRAHALNSLGAVLRSLGKYTEARERFERSLALRQKVLGPEHLEAVNSMANLAVILTDLGLPEEALRLHERVLELRGKALGPEHPIMASTFSNLGLTMEGLGKYPEAQRSYERALAIVEKVMGPDHIEVTTPLNNLGNVLSEQGHLEQALRIHERVLAIREKALDPEDASIAASLSNVAVVLGKMGRYEEARQRHERALAMLEKSLGPEHPFVATALNSLGSVFLAQGRLEEAKQHYERSLVIAEKAMGPEHPDLASSLIGLGETQMARGKTREGLAQLERALKLSLEVDRPNAQFSLAQALWKTKRELPRAQALATEAKQRWERLGASKQAQEVAQWLTENFRQ
jgi:tetratricopeptide (TPR) repeat protein/predicted Ser/Thr protein kinase